MKEARAKEACDEVLAELPQLGQDVVSAVEAVEAVLPQLVAAAERYDAFVEVAIHRLQTVAPPAPEATYEAGSGLSQRRDGTSHSPFAPGGATTPAEPEPVPIQRARAKFPRHGTPSVDGVALQSCRGPGQLAAVVVPALRALGASESSLENLKLAAAGAPQLPTI